MIGVRTSPVSSPSLVGLELVAQHVLDAQEPRDRLDLHRQRRRAEHHGMAAGHVSADEFTHLGIDAAHDLLHEEPLGQFVDVGEGIAAQHAGALADEVLEFGAAELMVEAGLHHADELPDRHLAAAQPVLRHDHAGEPGDQRAVEIEECADLGSRRARLDLGDRTRQPHGPAHGLRSLAVSRSHCSALPFGEIWAGVRTGQSRTTPAPHDRRHPGPGLRRNPTAGSVPTGRGRRSRRDRSAW